jgi:hypothetical protein
MTPVEAKVYFIMNLASAALHFSMTAGGSTVDMYGAGTAMGDTAPVFVFVSTRDVWIEANLKKVQLDRMRPGATQRPSRSIDTRVGDSQQMSRA